MKLQFILIALTFFMISTQSKPQNVNVNLKQVANVAVGKGPSAGSNQGDCSPPFHHVEGIGCIKFYAVGTHFTDAEQLCSEIVAELVVASDDVGRANLVKWINIDQPHWNGDIHEVWVGVTHGVWFNGVTVTDWVPGSPTESHCSPMTTNPSGSLDARDCTKNRRFICQKMD